MKRSTSWIAVLPSLVIPLSLGMSLYLGLLFLLDQQYVTNEWVLRYLTGHPISKVTVAMFLVGVASLAAIAKNVFEQFAVAKKIQLNHVTPDAGATPATMADGSVLLQQAQQHEQQLDQLPRWIHEHYLWQRLQGALASIRRTRATGAVEEELKYLADLDIDRQQQRYSLVRILIWATPMLGFLGTVLGISEALGGLNVGPDNDFQGMMSGLRGSLYVAFDTTALALTLSMLLMFAQFLVDRFEAQLLDLVDQRARGQIARHFDLSASDEQLQRFGAELVGATREAAVAQLEVWKKTIRQAEQAWSSSLTDSNQQVQANLASALDENIGNLAHYLGQAIEKADEAMSHRWQQWQVMLSENARVIGEHQRQLQDQAEELQAIVQRQQGETVLQDALQQNQAALTASQQLCQTLEDLRTSVVEFQQASTESLAVQQRHNEQAAAAAAEAERNRWLTDIPVQPATEATRTEPAPTAPLEVTRATDRTVDHAAEDQVSGPEIIRFESHLAAPLQATEPAATDSQPFHDTVDSDAEVIIKFPTQNSETTSHRLASVSDRAAEFLSARRQRRVA